ncbi:MAG: zinc-binding dehydrogenase [Myxococcales bacterium]|nr:zinc-binding dehydrogenase [Myxococcales bacterium]
MDAWPRDGPLAGTFAEPLQTFTSGHVVALNGTSRHLESLVELLEPQGQLGLVDDPEAFDIYRLKLKSISLHWEFMFTRSMFSTPDLDKQGRLLSNVAALIDGGRMKTTLTEDLGPVGVDALRDAHDRILHGRSIGKMVFQGLRTV